MIDFSKFEDKTRGGFAWEVIVPEDGLIRVWVHDEKTYLFVNNLGAVTSEWGGKNIDWASKCLVLKAREIDWRAGWRPSEGERYWTVNNDGEIDSFQWVDDGYDRYHAAIGNCYPDTHRGRLLAEARAKYEPMIAEIAGMDEPGAVFKWLRGHVGPHMVAPSPFPPDLELRKRDRGGYKDLVPAIRWLDSGYRLTIEEAEL